MMITLTKPSGLEILVNINEIITVETNTTLGCQGTSQILMRSEKCPYLYVKEPVTEIYRRVNDALDLQSKGR